MAKKPVKKVNKQAVRIMKKELKKDEKDVKDAKVILGALSRTK